MSAPRLAIISTRLPPALCGIGTHSWRLREHWPNEQSTVQFFVIEGSETRTPHGDGIVLFNGRAADLESALDQFKPTHVLLHYAGRAYQRLGLPIWLPRVLARWKRKTAGAQLGIFFHELPGRFPIRSRHFWLGKFSQRIVRQLAGCADLLFTNTEKHAAQLRHLTRRDDIHLLPVGSNIESAPPATEPRAQTEFLVFGLPFGRWQTLQAFTANIRQWQAAGLLTKLHLAGPEGDEFSARAVSLIDQALLVRHGALDSAPLGALLRRVGCALTNVSEETWSKSGAFMACAANECPVVLAGARPASVPLRHVVSAGEIGVVSESELATRAAALADWYRENADWPIIAQKLSALWPLAESPS